MLAAHCTCNAYLQKVNSQLVHKVYIYADPRIAKGGKHKATRAAPSDETAPKNNRLATLIAEAIFQDQEVLQEIQALLSPPAKATQKPEGTTTTASVSETGSVSQETETDDVASYLCQTLVTVRQLVSLVTLV